MVGTGTVLASGNVLRCMSSPALLDIWREPFADVHILSLWSFLLSDTLWTLAISVSSGPQLSGNPPGLMQASSPCAIAWKLKAVSWVTIGLISFVLCLLGISVLCCQWFIVLKTIVSYILSSLLWGFLVVVVLGKQYIQSLPPHLGCKQKSRCCIHFQGNFLLDCI